MDNVHVAIRVRPLIKREKDAASQIQWQCDKKSMQQTGNRNAKPYFFDRVFNHDEGTEDVYNEIAQPIVQEAMNGYNGTIFAYGQTSSGKTYTMQGNKAQPGIIPSTIDELFEIIENTPEREFLFRVSYMELYNEIITDLLADKKLQLTIRENSEGRVFVSNLHEAYVTDQEEVLKLMEKGNERRHIGKTNMNEYSSRSHTIFRIIIESRERRSETEEPDLAIRSSELNLVDLAGSERANETKAEGMRLKEAGNINRSLFSLCNVISKLSSGADFIPFRDSKLTRILQSALGGNAKAAIICTVTPVSLDQTESTLQFASRAKTITNKPEINEILTGEAQMQRCQNEIKLLKEQLKFYQQSQPGQDNNKIAKLEEEKLIQQRKIKELEGMILVSKGNLSDSSMSVKRKRRETWCPGALKRTMLNPRGTEDFSFKRKKMTFALANELGLEVNSSLDFGRSEIPQEPETSSSSSGDEAFRILGSSPTLKTRTDKQGKQRKGVTWADDHLHVATQTEPEEETKTTTDQQLNETLKICEELVKERELADQRLTDTREGFEKQIADLKTENQRMTQEMNFLKDQLKEVEELREFETSEKTVYKESEMELNAQIAALKGEISNINTEHEIITALEKERNERRVNELRTQLQVAYDDAKEQNGQAESKQMERESLVERLQAEKQILEEKLRLFEEERKSIENELSELRSTREEYKTLEEKLTSSLQEIETLKESADVKENNLRETLGELERLKNLEDDFEKMKTDSDSLREGLVASQEEVKELKEELKMSEQNKEKEISQLKEQVENAQSQLRLAREEVETVKESAEKILTEDLRELENEKVKEYEAELEVMKNDAETLKEEIQTYQDEIKMMMEEAKEVKDQQGEVAKLHQEEVLELTRVNITLSEEKSVLEKKIEELETAMQGMEEKADVEKLQGEIGELRQKLETQEQDFKLLEAEKEELDQYKTVVEENLNALQETLSQQEADLNVLRNDLEVLKEQNLTLTSSAEQLQKSRDEDEEKIDKMKKEIENLIATNTQMKADLEESITCSIEAQEELVKTQEALEDTKQKLRIVSQKESEETGFDHALLEDFQLQRENLEGEKNELKKRLETLQTEKEKFADENKELEKRLETLQTEKEKFADESKELEKRLEDLQLQNNNLAVEKNELETRLEDLKPQNEKLEDEKNQLEKKVEDHNLENEKLTEEKNKLESIEALQEEKEKLTDEKNKLERSLEDIQLQKEKLAVEKRELEENLKDFELQKENFAGQKDNLEARERLDNLQLQNEKLCDEKNGLEKRLEDLHIQNGNLVDEKNDLEKRLEDLQLQKERLADAKNEFEESLEDLQFQKKKLTDEKNELEIKLEDLHHQNENVVQERNELEKRLEDLEPKAEKLAAENYELETRLEDLRLQKEKLVNEKNESEIRLEDLQLQNEKLTEEKNKSELQLKKYEESANAKLKLMAQHSKKTSATITKYENDLREEKAKCKQLEEELVSLKSFSESHQSSDQDTKAADEVEKMKESLIQEQKLHSVTKKMKQELELQLKRYEESANAKLKLMAQHSKKTSATITKYENDLREEKAKCKQLEEELVSLKSFSESHQSSDQDTKAADVVEKMKESLIQEQKLHSVTKKMKQELELKLKRYEESANAKLKLMAEHSKKTSATITKYESDLREEKEKYKQLEEELVSLKSFSESHQSSDQDIKAADEVEKMKESLIQEQKLHSVTKKMKQDLEAKVSELESLQHKVHTESKVPKGNSSAVSNPSALSKEELVEMVQGLQAEQQSHLRQLQQYHQIMTDSSKPETVCSSGSGVVASVAVFHLKSHNYHLEKQNIVAEKQLKKLQGLLKDEKCKFREMEQKKEYWKSEFSKLKFGKSTGERIPTSSAPKPLKDNNTPSTHQSPAKRPRVVVDVPQSPRKIASSSTATDTSDTPQTWFDEEIDKISSQENCKTQ